MKYDRFRAVVLALVGAEDAAKLFKGGIEGVKKATKITDFEESYATRWITLYAKPQAVAKVAAKKSAK